MFCNQIFFSKIGTNKYILKSIKVQNFMHMDPSCALFTSIHIPTLPREPHSSFHTVVPSQWQILRSLQTMSTMILLQLPLTCAARKSETSAEIAWGPIPQRTKLRKMMYCEPRKGLIACVCTATHMIHMLRNST